MLIQCFPCFYFMTFNETHVLALWQSMVLIFLHYGTLCNSCFLSILPNISWLHVFLRPKTFRITRRHIVIQGCWSLLSPLYQHFFTSLLFSCRLSLRSLVSTSFVSCLKRALYDSNGWKYGSWNKFLNVWNSKWEIMVSRVSIMCTILCFNVWFVWNRKTFGSLKTCKPYSAPHYDHFMIFIQAILLYEQFMTIHIWAMVPYISFKK